MRKDFLRGYLMALVSDGALAGATSPVEIARRAVAVFTEDVKSAGGEILALGVANLGRRVADRALEKMDILARDFFSGKRGFGEIWLDLKETYNRGVEVKSKARK